MSKHSQFDIVIVGGGMVGLAMAASLSETGLSIAVIERHSLSLETASNFLVQQDLAGEDFDIRVSAINPLNRTFLERVGAWQKIPKCRIAEYEKMYVWDGESSGEIEFDAAELKNRNLGCIVENQVIQAALLQTVSESSQVHVFDNVQLLEIENSEKIVYLRLAELGEISTKLLIGADGANSVVRRMQEIPCSEIAYDQIAFVATVKTEKSHLNKAWQRFTRFGPVAFLPLPSHDLCSIVWSADKEKAAVIEQYSDQEFEANLAKAFEFKLGNIRLKSHFRGFPLIKRHAESYIDNRCVLVGDAAHTIHPLAGQGVNLGFQDVACLSKHISQLVQSERDFGHPLNLQSYQRERKALNRLTQETMSGFKWLFGSRDISLTLLRSFGMSQLNNNRMIKKFIAKQAMGI